MSFPDRLLSTKLGSQISSRYERRATFGDRVFTSASGAGPLREAGLVSLQRPLACFAQDLRSSILTVVLAARDERSEGAPGLHRHPLAGLFDRQYTGWRSRPRELHHDTSEIPPQDQCRRGRLKAGLMPTWLAPESRHSRGTSTRFSPNDAQAWLRTAIQIADASGTHCIMARSLSRQKETRGLCTRC